MDFFTGQAWRGLKSCYTGGGPEQGFRRCFTYRLNQAPIVENVDNAVHWINLYPVENEIGFPNAYLLDGDSSGG